MKVKVLKWQAFQKLNLDIWGKKYKRKTDVKNRTSDFKIKQPKKDLKATASSV